MSRGNRRKQMRVGRSQAEKQASHDRIVRAAAAQVRRDGVDAVRVSELMREAGLTHGGFYRHFGSRDDLIDAAVETALADGSKRTYGAGGADPAAVLVAVIDDYLSPLHRDEPETGCAVAALPADISRCGPNARQAYSRQVHEYLERLGRLVASREGDVDRDEVFLTLSALVGAVSIARAVDEPSLSDEILARTAQALHRLLGEAPGDAPARDA